MDLEIENRLNLASQLHAAGKYQEALQMALPGLERSARSHDPLVKAWCCNEVGFYCLHAGVYEKAIGLFQEALEIRRRVLGSDHPNTATCINNLAAFHSQMGQYEAALPLYQEALEIRRRVSGSDHPSTAASINNLASLHQSLGQYEAAMPLFQEALEICRRVLGSDHPDTATSISNLAHLNARMGQYEAAMPLFQEVLAIEDRMMRRHFRVMSQAERVAYADRFLSTLFVACTLVAIHRANDAGAVEWLYEAVLRRKEAETLLLAAQREALLGERAEYAPYTGDLRRWIALQEQVSQAAMANPHDPALPALRAEADTLERRLAMVIPEITKEHQSMTVARSAVALSLPESSALIEFVKYRRFDVTKKKSSWAEERYLAFAVTPAALHLVELGDAEPIDALVQTFLAEADSAAGRGASDATFIDTDWQDNARTSLQEIFTRVLLPLQPLLTGKSRLLVAPDGPLAFVPFDLLEDAAGRSVGDNMSR